MQYEIEAAEGCLGFGEHPSDVFVFLDVAGGDQLGSGRLGQLANPALHLVARKVREAQLGALGHELLGDRPGDAEVVGDSEDHSLFS